MSLLRQPLLAADLGRIDLADNPMLAHDNIGKAATASTGLGTQIMPAINVQSGATYNFWRATPASGAAELHFVFAASTTLGFVGIDAHNLIEVGASLVAEYSTDAGSSWVSAGIAAHTPATARAIGFHFRPTTAAHWRLRFAGATGDLVVGVVMLSVPLILPTRIYQGYRPALTPNNVALEPNISQGGHIMGSRVVQSASSISAALNHLPNAFVRGPEWLAFQRAFNVGAPFFWAWRPDSYPDLDYCQRAGAALSPVNSSVPGHSDASLAMAVFDDT